MTLRSSVSSYVGPRLTRRTNTVLQSTRNHAERLLLFIAAGGSSVASCEPLCSGSLVFLRKRLETSWFLSDSLYVQLKNRNQKEGMQYLSLTKPLLFSPRNGGCE
jgi:hypothetical protein